jgi:FlaG/FlaF family flagellin (archaellin)
VGEASPLAVAVAVARAVAPVLGDAVWVAGLVTLAGGVAELLPPLQLVISAAVPASAATAIPGRKGKPDDVMTLPLSWRMTGWPGGHYL